MRESVFHTAGYVDCLLRDSSTLQRAQGLGMTKWEDAGHQHFAGRPSRICLGNKSLLADDRGAFMNHRWTITFLLLGALLLAGCMSTSFSGNYVLQPGETLRGNLFVTSGSVTLQEGSRVTGSIVLTSGELHIGQNAQVGKDVVLTSGALYMADGAVVHGDVILSSQDIAVQQAPGSQVEGSITYNIAPFIISTLTRGLLLYCVLPIVLLIALILVLGLWLGRASRKGAQVAQAPAPVATEDAQQKLQKLKAMLDEGLITETDYETKKAEILSKM
jgi:hypothetical protein